MKSRLLRVVVASEDAGERQILTQVVEGLPGTVLAAEVTLVCQMGKQAGHVAADCVVLDIDRYPLAGLLSLAQARATFPGAGIIVLARAIQPRLLHFLTASGASCCLDKDDPERHVRLITALRAIGAAGESPARRPAGRLAALDEGRGRVVAPPREDHADARERELSDLPRLGSQT